jgi:hypothetical protein
MAVASPHWAAYCKAMRTLLCRSCLVKGLSLCALLGAGAVLLADQVELQNGDRYVGKVLSLTTNQLTLQSEVLGTVKLPREKVAVVTLGPVAKTNATHTAAIQNAPLILSGAKQTNSNSEIAAAFRQLGANTNLIQQVQRQFLSDAGPEANSKYNELLGGLMSGKVSMDDLRAQAKAAADQVRSLKGEMGDQTGILDGYLTILDKFVNESTPASGSKPAAPASQPNSEGNTP